MANETSDKPSTGKGSAKGGRPRKEVNIQAVLASPEGRAAIAAAAAEAAQAAMADFQTKLGALPLAQGQGAGDLHAVISNMALSFASLSDQGSGRVRVAPEEQARRDQAKERMGVLLMQAAEEYKEAKFRGDRAGMDKWMPAYELLIATHIADRLVQPFTDVDGVAEPTQIDWQGAPGPSMRPINDIATRIFELYTIWIGGIPDTINGQAAQPQWVRLGRDGNMVVRTTAGARFRDSSSGRRQLGGLHDTGEMPQTESGPAFAQRRRGANLKADTRHILGTAVPPARDMVPGESRRA